MWIILDCTNCNNQGFVEVDAPCQTCDGFGFYAIEAHPILALSNIDFYKTKEAAQAVIETIE